VEAITLNISYASGQPRVEISDRKGLTGSLGDIVTIESGVLAARVCSDNADDTG